MIVREFNIKPFANLSGADLRCTDLTGADLRCAVLSGADLRRADLVYANLWGADLSDADLSDADLSGADLSGAWLRKTKITAEQLMWLTLTGQITPDQAAGCKVLKTKELLTC